MKRLHIVLLTATLLTATQTAFAQRGGFIQKLPKDGSWASYHLNGKAEEGPQPGITGEVTIRSVGTEMENGEKCRWIELQMAGEANNMKQNTIIKVLLREKDLQPGAKSKMKVIRGWVKDRDQDVQSFADAPQGQTHSVEAFFAGKLQEAKSVKKERTIDYQKGKLTLAEAVTGKHEMKPPENNVNIKQSLTQTIWKHKSVPFGTAALEIQIEIKRDDMVLAKMTMTFNLKDHGTGAKSALPDKN